MTLRASGSIPAWPARSVVTAADHVNSHWHWTKARRDRTLSLLTSGSLPPWPDFPAYKDIYSPLTLNCTQKFVFADIRLSPSLAGLSGITRIFIRHWHWTVHRNLSLLTSGFLPPWPDFPAYKDIYSPLTLNCTQKFVFADIRLSPSLAGLSGIQGYLFATDIELYIEICLCWHQALSLLGRTFRHTRIFIRHWHWTVHRNLSLLTSGSLPPWPDFPAYKDIYSPLTLNCTQKFVFADIRLSPSLAGLSSIQGYKIFFRYWHWTVHRHMSLLTSGFLPPWPDFPAYKDIYSPLTLNCTQKFVFADIRLSPSLAGLSSIQGYKIFFRYWHWTVQTYVFADIRLSPSLAGLSGIQGYLFATDIELYTEICLCWHQALSLLGRTFQHTRIFIRYWHWTVQTYVFADIRLSPSLAGLSGIQGYKDIYSPLTLNCTQKFVFADIRLSPSLAGLSGIQGYKDIYSPLTLNCTQKFVFADIRLSPSLAGLSGIQGYKDIYSPMTLNCTQKFVFADIRLSPSLAGLSSIQR